jgi:predicted transcriptional regulator of viral defense system
MSTKGKIKTIDFFAENPVFSLDDATEWLKVPRSRSGTVERLKYHLKTGRLLPVTRGIYAVVPPGVLRAGFKPDPFLAAAAIRKDAIFSHHSALELLGTAHSVWNRCTLYTRERRRPIDMKYFSISFLADPGPFAKNGLRYLGTQKIERLGRLLTVTGAERTLVDGLRRTALSGGVEELIVSAGGFPVLDLEMLDKILRCCDSTHLWAAAGWFLEHFRDRFHVEEGVLLEIEKHRPRSPRYFERNSRGGILVPRWNLIMPASVVKRNNSDEP